MKVPPDAVRVWRGFRAPELATEDFFARLATVFVPASVELQAPIGLDAYIPTVAAGVQGKPASVPDETGLLFWDSQQAYHESFSTLAVRTYTLAHGAVYTKESRADFPTLFGDRLVPNLPSFLFEERADWMCGSVAHVIGGPREGARQPDFASQVATVMSGIQSRCEAEAAIVCVGDAYVVYWQLGGGTDRGLGELEAVCGWSMRKTARQKPLPAGLWDPWPGMALAPGDSLNLQFRRRGEA